tara:strand:+ start:10696 stop:12873 length:2178 start_codon:yes stop_codon:yes gene_type:complete
MKLSRKYLKKYKSRTLSNNKKKAYNMLNNNSEKYLTAKELFSMTRLKKIKFSKNKTKKNKMTPEIKTRMKMINYINREYKKKANKNKINTLAKEFKSRMKEQSQTYPTDGKKYKYFYKQNKGDNFPIYYVKLGCDEVEILNTEKLSKGHEYFSIEDISISPNEKYIIFSIDFTGNRLCKLYIKPLLSNNYEEIFVKYKTNPLITTHDFLSESDKTNNEIKKYSTISSGNCVWSSDSKNIYYITYDKTIRPCKLYIYNIETKKHTFLFEEKNMEKSLSISSVESDEYVVVYSGTYNGSDVYVIVENELKLIYKLQPDVEYFVGHSYGTWIIFKKKHDNCVIYSTNDFKKEKKLISNKPNQLFQYMHLQGDYILIFYKSKGFNKIMAYHYCERKMINSSLKLCTNNSGCSFNIPHFNNLNEYVNHCTINVQSFLMPLHGYFLDLKTMKWKEIYKMTVKNYDYKKYVEKILYVTKDLHIIMMYKKGTILKNAKCVLWGYGAYGVTRDPEFDIFIPSLLNRGFIFCIAYIRGGGRHGHKWYKQGRMLNKINTFDDFIKCANYLIDKKYTISKKLAIWGRSAGGLVIGATLNMAPQICNLAILGVPFLDPIQVLSNPNNPLSSESHIEWGNPAIPKVKSYMEKYSPQDNICKQLKYPNIYIYSNINDTLVPYMEPFNYYNTIKQSNVFTSGEKDIIMQIKMKFGHSQSSKRYEKLKEMGEIYDIILKYII